MTTTDAGPSLAVPGGAERAPGEGQPPLDQLAAALAAFQAEMPVVMKTQTARVRTRDGDSYSYTYAGLAEVTQAAMPLLAKHGLSFVTLPGHNQLTGMLLHSSGQYVSAWLPIQGNSPQQIGSALTYMRRYLLGCLTGLVTDDDDDGQAAEKGARRPTQKATQSGDDTARPASKTVRTRRAQQKQDAGQIENVPLPDAQAPNVSEPRAPVAPGPPAGSPTSHQAPQASPELRPINDQQRGQVMATLSRIGIDPTQDREMRLALFSALLARPVQSTQQLSYSEANQLLRLLNDIEHGQLEWDYLVPENAVHLRWAKG